MTMWFRSLIRFLNRSVPPTRPSRRPSARPQVEPLEARSLPSSVTIGPGASIQAAVDAATPGTTMYLRPGTYLQSVVINKPDIALVGLGPHKPVIADPAGA